MKGKTALITGGASGIGLACAKRYVAEGGNVALVDLNQTALDEASRQLGDCAAFRCDVSDADQVEQCVDKVFETMGNVDVLINSAGIMRNAPLVNLLDRERPRHPADLWDQVLGVNLSSVFYMTSCVASGMVSRRTRGVIVSLSSISAHGNAGQTAYTASKAGINAMTVTWAKELGVFGIRCNAVAPGFIDTAATGDALEEERLQTWVNQTPLRRMGRVDEIVDAIWFCINNDFYNGQVLEVNGGLRI